MEMNIGHPTSTICTLHIIVASDIRTAEVPSNFVGPTDRLVQIGDGQMNDFRQLYQLICESSNVICW
jgi:hypothetical protein